MSRHISTSDPIWKDLQEATGEFFVDDFREKMSKDERLWKLAKQDTSSQPPGHLTIKIIQEYERYKMGQSTYTSLEDQTPKRNRCAFPGGNTETGVASTSGRRFPTDPSGAISGLLNGLARCAYQPAMEAILTIEEDGRIAFDAEEFAKLLTDISTIEGLFVGQELPSAEDDGENPWGTYHALMDDYFLGEREIEDIDKERDTLRQRIMVRKYADVASLINAHIDEVIANAQPVTAEILHRADFNRTTRPEYRLLRVLEDWSGGHAIPVVFHRECKFLAAVERLCVVLAAHYGWMEEHALVFIFAGVSPPTGSIRVHFRMREDIPCQSRIILEVEPNIPIETVTKVFELARRHVLQDGTKPRMISTKSMALASHIYARRPGFGPEDLENGWKCRLNEWNQNYAPYLKNLSRTPKGKPPVKNQATFNHVSTFKAACNRARDSLLFPPYKIINSEGYFIAGTKLPTLDLLNRSTTEATGGTKLPDDGFPK